MGKMWQMHFVVPYYFRICFLDTCTDMVGWRNKMPSAVFIIAINLCTKHFKITFAKDEILLLIETQVAAE